MLFMLYDCKYFKYVMYFILCYMCLPITLKGYICAVNKILFYSILFYSRHKNATGRPFRHTTSTRFDCNPLNRAQVLQDLITFVPKRRVHVPSPAQVQQRDRTSKNNIFAI